MHDPIRRHAFDNAGGLVRHIKVSSRIKRDADRKREAPREFRSLAVRSEFQNTGAARHIKISLRVERHASATKYIRREQSDRAIRRDFADPVIVRVARKENAVTIIGEHGSPRARNALIDKFDGVIAWLNRRLIDDGVADLLHRRARRKDWSRESA